VDCADEHVHRGNELGADLLDTAVAEHLAIDAAAVLLEEVVLHGVLAERRGLIVARESGAVRYAALEVGEVGEVGLRVVEDTDFGDVAVASRGGLVEGSTAGATVDERAVADDLEGVSKKHSICPVSLCTYEVSGNRKGRAQAEDA
jgi:hypothetical protein